jgi:hypothetical protein
MRDLLAVFPVCAYGMEDAFAPSETVAADAPRITK